MEKALIHVLTRFPDHVGQIIDLFQADENFRELCEDFLFSSEALSEYKLNEIRNHVNEQHFVDIYADLEKEIIALLKKDLGSKQFQPSK